ncbi:MAG: hypothetical protein WD066_14885 [Planctomycetaceae bacterium]
MNASPQLTFSIEVLSWINEQLRERIAAEEEARLASRFSVRMKAALATGLSGIAMAVCKLF